MKDGFTLEEIGKRVEAKIVGDPSYLLKGVDELATATPTDVSFLANTKYENLALSSYAGVICVNTAHECKEGKNYLVSDNPSLTFQKVISLFLIASDFESGFKGVHPTAIIHETASIGDNVTIGPYSIIDKRVVIGDHTIIHGHVTISPQAVIGTRCAIHSQVTIREGSQIGNRVVIQPGAVIGACGFGYLTDENGNHHKIPQLGNVILEDDVEIGANTTIDRARFKSTTIAKGTKVDNLVQIGHNVSIGENSILVSQTGVSGSVRIGKNVVIGGQTGLVGHIQICDRVKIGAQSGVSKSILKPGNYRGFPLAEYTEFNRYAVHLKKIGQYANKIKELESRLEEIEEASRALVSSS